jgi:nitroreductase
MDVYEAIKLRKSVRSYLSKPVEEDKLQRVLEAGRLAPSARNTQEWRFVVARDEETRRKLSVAAANQSFVAEAPVVLACCAETDHHLMRCGLECFPIDVAIAIDHITLAATAEGLGTCWIGAFDADEVKAVLGIPDDIVVVEVLPLGYPADPGPKEKSRLAMAEIVRYEKW